MAHNKAFSINCILYETEQLCISKHLLISCVLSHKRSPALQRVEEAQQERRELLQAMRLLQEEKQQLQEEQKRLAREREQERETCCLLRTHNQVRKKGCTERDGVFFSSLHT